jgi:hypothetical protein
MLVMPFLATIIYRFKKTFNYDERLGKLASSFEQSAQTLSISPILIYGLDFRALTIMPLRVAVIIVWCCWCLVLDLEVILPDGTVFSTGSSHFYNVGSHLRYGDSYKK